MEEKPRHVDAYMMYRDMPSRNLRQLAKDVGVSEASITTWKREFKWAEQLLAWDNAVKEGVEERSLEFVVDARIKELNILEKTMDRIDVVLPIVETALMSCTSFDPKTGERVVSIIPETPQDVSSLCTAQTRLIGAKVKVIETMRKVRGETEKVDMSGDVKLTAEISPEMAKKIGEALVIDGES